VKLPSNCPDGTCDGCLYHIIIYSSHACPICTDNDYSIIKGECINGMQSVHSIPARRLYREYKKERNLSHKGDREDSGQTPFVPLEQAD
ncbi:hypothetical protein X798_06585, partial [Onchocerca flexuosa]